jgi:hypothetical protein
MNIRPFAIACAALVGAVGVAPAALAQKEAMGMFYELQLAPVVCHWHGTGDRTKLDATIAAQERALGVSAAERAEMMRTAEAELRADPANCAADGMLRPMYDEAVK